MIDFEKQKAELVELAKTAKNNMHWFKFMQKLEIALPFLFERDGGTGSYPPELVAESLVGLSGYTGVIEFITSSVEKGGLGVTDKTYENWRSAYNTVRANPYLSELNLGNTQIHKLKTEAKDFELDFPGTAEQYKEFKERIKEIKVEKKQAKLDEVYAANEQLKAEIAALKKQLREIAQPQKIGRLSHLAKFFTG
jgi:hypothetical protein